jgi:hypothetical protein
VWPEARSRGASARDGPVPAPAVASGSWNPPLGLRAEGAADSRPDVWVVEQVEVVHPGKPAAEVHGERDVRPGVVRLRRCAARDQPPIRIESMLNAGSNPMNCCMTSTTRFSCSVSTLPTGPVLTG